MKHYVLNYVPSWYRVRRVRHWLGKSEVTVAVMTKQWRIGLHYAPFRGYRLSSFEMHVGPTAGQIYYYPYFGDYQVNRRSVRATDPSAAIPSAKIDTKFLRTLPCLLAHCSATQYDDRSPRKPGWITIATQGVAWRVTVKDPDSAASLSVTAPTIDEALAACEALVSDPASPWEPDEWLAAKKPKKKRG